MKKHPLFTFTLVLGCLLFISFAKADNYKPAEKVLATTTADSTAVADATSLSQQLYQELELDEAGLKPEVLDYAIAGYEKLDSQGRVDNPVLTIVDFSQSSRKKRLYLIDMENRRLVTNTFVAHGKRSGVDMATNFSNRMHSEASSLGFYLTKQTYQGKHGLSLRLSGQERGFNDNAEARGVVVHGADYVNSGRVNSDYMGRSQGCPALSMNEYASVIREIQGGSVLFIYAPEETYLESSSFLN